MLKCFRNLSAQVVGEEAHAMTMYYRTVVISLFPTLASPLLSLP